MLRFDHVRYAYRRTLALDDVSITAGPGITGLLGVNGAGKSTLLRLAVGELQPADGTVTVDGGSARRGRRTGYCPQVAHFPDRLEVIDLLGYLAWLRRVPRSQVERQIANALDWGALWPQKDARVGSLSGGMARRLTICQALIGSPSLLLLDEPTTGLDPEQRSRIRKMLRELPIEATTILSSHIVEDIAALASTVIILDEGRIRTTVDVAEIASGDESLEEYFLSTIAHMP